MGKKGRSRTHQDATPTKSLPPAQILQRFKSLWAAGEWAEALNCYQTWAGRMGKKQDPRIESELLFRCASIAWQKGNIEKALSMLGEARSRDQKSQGRYLGCQGICKARQGRLKEGLACFTEAGDQYHAAVLSSLIEKDKPLPKSAPGDIAYEKHQLLGFWQGLSDPSAREPSSVALRKLRSAYAALTKGEDPDSFLASLKDKPGCEDLTLYLAFLAAVHQRRNIRIRHLISNNPAAFHETAFLSLLDSHLLLLLKDHEYREIDVLNGLFEEHHLRPGRLDEVMDELRFASALDEIEAGKLGYAIGRLSEIRRRTPSLIHNLALLYQKMGEYAEANENWITLLKLDGKPKRSDPEERRLAYAAAAKHIASNYLAGDQPAKAIHFLKEALIVSEDDREALENLSDVFCELGEVQDGIIYARRLYELDPRDERYMLEYLWGLYTLRDIDLLLRLIEEHWQRFAAGSKTRGALAHLAARAAWLLRASRPEKAREVYTMVREVDRDIPSLLYLEAFFLDQEGKRDQAEERFAALIERTGNHSEQSLFGMALHDEGFRDQAIVMFARLTDCGCEEAEKAFENIISFLCGKNDQDGARKLCLQAMERHGFGNYAIADILLEAEKPQWAREFSDLVLSDPDSGEEEYFLHLLILNKIGNGPETLAFAQLMEDRFANGAQEDFSWMLRHIIKQLKTKGRAEIPYG